MFLQDKCLAKYNPFCLLFPDPNHCSFNFLVRMRRATCPSSLPPSQCQPKTLFISQTDKIFFLFKPQPVYPQTHLHYPLPWFWKQPVFPSVSHSSHPPPHGPCHRSYPQSATGIGNRQRGRFISFFWTGSNVINRINQKKATDKQNKHTDFAII